jgi:hypothetical protein
MAELMPDLALTGVPRGGTTLACRLLGQAQDTLALFEPMSVESLPQTSAAAADAVADYFVSVRAQVLRERRAPSKQREGQVPDNPVGDRLLGMTTRPFHAELGEIAVDKPLSARFHLVIKHNAAFIALLPDLVNRMPVLGVVRHPLAVLASWHSVDLPVSHGRLPAGERLDCALAERLDRTPDVLQRQLIILDWCFDRLHRYLPSKHLLRYEDIVADGGAGLQVAAGVDASPAHVLHDRNANAQYDRTAIVRLADALLGQPGAWMSFYDQAAVRTLAERMLADEPR